MRILVLNYEYPPLGGGGAPVCRELCRRFAQRGHTVDVVTMGFCGLPPLEEADGVRVLRVPALRRRQATCETHEMISYVVSALPRVIARLRSEAYDVIHAHFAIPTGLLACLATRIVRVPYAITIHGSDIPGFNPDRFTYEHRVTRPLLRRVFRRAAWLSASSDFLRKLAVANVGDFEFTYLPNGIDVSRFEARPKKRNILMTGRLLPRKGFQHVLTALKEVETDFEIHIAGDGPMRDQLKALAKTMRPRVVFHGWLDHDSPELKELYETAAIFCLTSERENASISLLEAMLAGAAVVTSNGSGCLETIGDSGLAVPPANTHALQEILLGLMASETRRNELGARARQRVIDRFDWDKITSGYLEHLEAMKNKASP